jgi:hypothetical protein
VISFALLALALITVAVVNRWWALSIAFAPFAALWFLHSATDYSYPYHEDPYPAIAIVGTVFALAICSLGFLLRAVVDRLVSGEWQPWLRDKQG